MSPRTWLALAGAVIALGWQEVARNYDCALTVTP